MIQRPNDSGGMHSRAVPVSGSMLKVEDASHK